MRVAWGVLAGWEHLYGRAVLGSGVACTVERCSFYGELLHGVMRVRVSVWHLVRLM